MARVAIVGYGSLLWDLDDLEPHVRGDWQLDQGPRLPFEFSLVSRKRIGALAVVIDHHQGDHCAASIIDSHKRDVGEAVADLARRERCDEHHIGLLHRDGRNHTRSASTLQLVKGWLETTSYDAVVWTDIESNFESRTGTPFSPDVALAYLQSLTGDSLREAKRYIDNAPAAVSTPLRRLLQSTDWWHEIALSEV